MRIHFFVRTLNDITGGGSHYNSIAFVRALRAHGHTVVMHVFSGGAANAFPDDIVPEVHDGWGMSFRRSRTYLAELLRKYESEADVYFLYAVEFAWGGGLYRRTGGVVPVVTYMDAYLPSMNMVHLGSFKDRLYHFKRLPWDKTIGILDARHVDQFLPVSPYIGDVYKKFGFPKNRFTVLPSIVPPPPNEVLEQVSQKKKNSEVQILYVGRLIYEKGVDLLINALASLKEYSWKLVIVGDGPMRAAVEQQVKESNLPIDVRGWVTREEVWSAYATSDIFVHPARWSDPGPRSIVDALWCDLPVVVPDTGGSAWIAGDAGLVFKTGDLAELTNRLQTLLANKDDIRETLAARAKTHAHLFEENVVYTQLEQILLSAIEHTQS